MTHFRSVPQLFPCALAVAVALTFAACSKAPEPSVASPPDMAATGAGPVQVSDLAVTEHVKTALQNDEVLKGFDIQVVTNKGDVRLIGVLNTQAQIDEALRIARAAEGAHSIHDELSVKP
ncbi:BON domain-containing protein [Paucibacter sp. Y2R2-4]|uniref:BON domain-containing protein n=1 Tax=Paucibacter sp. Y2R2-4 TaxID=2893553 RepID=UPI0021E3DBBA|nr:BON domain-containing protein [Paucibacter sp. Y2R2-4]MCV2350955.1 BON domain-containing protein [Paucibacter sp. Y2R2-4]